MLQTTNGCAIVGAQFRRYFLKILPNSLEKKLELKKINSGKMSDVTSYCFGVLVFWCFGVLVG